MKRLLISLFICIATASMAAAQTSLELSDLSSPSKIAPAYFGPNAFPVPDMLDGRTSSELKLELYGDCFLGTTTGRVADDITGDIFAKLTVPLLNSQLIRCRFSPPEFQIL